MFKLRKGIYLLIAAALMVFPLVLLFLPVTYFDHGAVWCPSKRFLHLECPGCGITRGIQHLLHLEFEAAWSFNKLSFLVLPALIYFWFKWIWLLLRKAGFPARETPAD